MFDICVRSIFDLLEMQAFICKNFFLLLHHLLPCVVNADYIEKCRVRAYRSSGPIRVGTSAGTSALVSTPTTRSKSGINIEEGEVAQAVLAAMARTAKTMRRSKASSMTS